jgi:hypothetical protein
MTETILIPSAGTIKNKIHFLKYTYDSPALIPVGTKSLASHIIDFYLESLPEAKIYIGVDRKFVKVLLQYLSDYKSRISVIPVSDSIGVNDTLKVMFKEAKPSGKVLVNLGTTIPTDRVGDNEVFIDCDLSTADEWSVVSSSSSANRSFHYKGSDPEIKGHAFTGIFKMDSNDLANALKSLNHDEMGDLLFVVDKVFKNNEFNFKKVTWIDCGHEMNYYKAKTKLISSRTFNNISVTPIKSTLVKRSLHLNTQENEINYVHNLPQGLKVYFPRVINGPLKRGKYTEVELEYYGYPTLAEYMLFWDLSNGLWRNIFNAISKVMSEFQVHTKKITLDKYLDFYMGKTVRRLNELKDQVGEHSRLFLHYLVINNIEYKNIHLMTDLITERLEQIYLRSRFNIMHGDLCFNNILYDIYSGTIRMIDARGSFDNDSFDIYGDQGYDIAKITHSVIGKYDYIVNGLFDYVENPSNYEYSIYERENHDSLVKMNTDLVNNFGYKLNDVMFLVSLLFISMTPLHNENIKRQKTLFLHGITMLNKTMGE